MRPKAVVISASAIPAEMPARPPDAPAAAMPVKAFTIPIVVPSRPTNGAVAPTVASTPRPRLNSDSVISICALDRPLGRVDVGGGDGGAVAEQRLHLGQRAAQHPGDVARLVLLGQRDGLLEVLFLDGAGELRARTSGSPSALFLIWMSLVIATVSEIDRHDRQDDDDALGERAHRGPQMQQI